MNINLSIITINYNDAIGLEKTIRSVQNQTCTNFEYVIIDGGSTDNSCSIIKNVDSTIFTSFKWISEKDAGIYNAMNKGIKMASGKYLQFVNSGDVLASNYVYETISILLDPQDSPAIIYGNMLKDNNNYILKDKSFEGRKMSLYDFYFGTLNHSSSYIKKELFGRFGLYDESLKIVSDWKWFLQTIILGDIQPRYFDYDITIFKMDGISVSNIQLGNQERKLVLEKLFPSSVLADYKNYGFLLEQIKRIKRYSFFYAIFWFIERCLYRIEKYNLKRKKISKVL